MAPTGRRMFVHQKSARKKIGCARTPKINTAIKLPVVLFLRIKTSVFINCDSIVIPDLFMCKSQELTAHLRHIIMVALWNRADHYIFALWFLISYFFFLFSSPNLSRRRLDVCHTSTHGVALVRISDAGLKRAACGSLKIQCHGFAMTAARESPIIILAVWHRRMAARLAGGGTDVASV